MGELLEQAKAAADAKETGTQDDDNEIGDITGTWLIKSPQFPGEGFKVFPRGGSIIFWKNTKDGKLGEGELEIKGDGYEGKVQVNGKTIGFVRIKLAKISGGKDSDLKAEYYFKIKE